MVINNDSKSSVFLDNKYTQALGEYVGQISLSFVLKKLDQELPYISEDRMKVFKESAILFMSKEIERLNSSLFGRVEMFFSSRFGTLNKYQEFINQLDKRSSEFRIPDLQFLGLSQDLSQQCFQIYEKKVHPLVVHPLRQLPTPFKRKIDHFEKELSRVQTKLSGEQTAWFGLLKIEELGLISALQAAREGMSESKDGKRVLCQQSPKACFPTCVAMLAMDRETNPALKNSVLSDDIFLNELTDSQGGRNLIAKVGFESIPSMLTKSDDKIKLLNQLIEKNGSGILSVRHPVFLGHVVILDKIDLDKKEAIIRDPAEGRMLTIPSDDLLEWIGSENEFVQFGQKISFEKVQEDYQLLKQQIEELKAIPLEKIGIIKDKLSFFRETMSSLNSFLVYFSDQPLNKNMAVQMRENLNGNMRKDLETLYSFL